MAVITTHARVRTFPQKPMVVSITANEWRVARIDPRASEFAPWCDSDVTFFVMFFKEPGVDGPEDGGVSNSGDYDMSTMRSFAGNSDPAQRGQPSIRYVNRHKAFTPRFVAVTSDEDCTVLAELYGEST